MRILRHLKGERGLALPMALGVMFVLTISTTAAIYYTSTNSRNASYSKGKFTALTLAEAGLNNTMAVLNLPTNNSLKQSIMPSCAGNPPPTPRRDDYAGGYVLWCGTLDQSQAAWSVTSTGYVRSPNNATEIRRKLTAYVTITPTLTQPLNNPSWNYIYSRKTGSPCDMNLTSNLSGASRLYVAGNLCMDSNAAITSSSLVVDGNLDLLSNARVGQSTNMSTRVETYVGGNCRKNGGAWAVPCTGNQDSRSIFSKLADGVTIGVSNDPPVIVAPVSDFPLWYENAIPGPAAQTCTTSSGTPPVFDTDYPNRNNNVPVFNLTPSSSYTCRVGPAGNPSGELSWNNTTKTLTTLGTIYIDGSARITNDALNSYNGQATLYLSGTFRMSGSSKLCGGVSGGTCDFAAWNPNTEMLTIVADGNNGDAGSGNSILVESNAIFQGGLFATNNIQFTSNARSDGPLVGWEIKFDSNVQNDQFPTITTVPVGMPGNPAVYAQPNPPQRFAG